MRQNVKQAYTAWAAGKALRPAVSIWTDGKTIWSYQTAIVTRDSRGVVHFNNTAYSTTTRTQQNSLQAALRADGVNYVWCDGVPRGLSACGLRNFRPQRNHTGDIVDV